MALYAPARSCGQAAPIAKRNNPRLGYVKGEPMRFVHAHSAYVRDGPLEG